ncbi:TPA: antirestriction protein ArdR [Pseudomonas aeruginosa]
MIHDFAGLRAAAALWRSGHQEHHGGVVLLWQSQVYGWKNCLRDASHERPGVYAVDEAGHIFIAEGGDEYNGAKCWVAVGPPN